MTGEPTIQQLFDLTGRTALVTGGTGHLGSAMSRALAEAGATVIVSSRFHERAVVSAAALPTPAGQQHAAVVIDHMDGDSIERGWSEAAAVTGAVDVLVNNGHEAQPNDWRRVTMDEFARHLANAAGYFELARRARDLAAANGRPASVVMLGSMYGTVASYPDAYEGVCQASPAAYHALKGGVLHLTRHLAAYWAADGVRVNCLSPGPFPSEKAPAAMVERLKTKLPMRRMGVAHELKGAVVFLASDASSFMTGQNLLIDGGWTAW